MVDDTPFLLELGTLSDRGEVPTYAHEPAVLRHVARLNARLGDNHPEIDSARKVVRALEQDTQTFVALDTEFYGWCDGDWDPTYSIATRSTVGRVAPFLTSIAYYSSVNDKFTSYVVAGQKDAATVVKCLNETANYVLVHNAPVDFHALTNIGLAPERVIDTLQLARLILPGLQGYGLDDLYRRYMPLRDAKPASYREFVHVEERYDAAFTTEKQTEVSRCICGDDDCRKRKEPHERYKTTVTKPTKQRRAGVYRYALDPTELTTLGLMPAFATYCRHDAEMLFELWQEVLRPKLERERRTTIAYPFVEDYAY